MRAGGDPEAEDAPHAHHLHPQPDARARGRVPEPPVPGRVHEGGAGQADGTV